MWAESWFSYLVWHLLTQKVTTSSKWTPMAKDEGDGFFSYSLTQNDLRESQRELVNGTIKGIKEENRGERKRDQRRYRKGENDVGCGGSQHTGRIREQQLAQMLDS